MNNDPRNAPNREEVEKSVKEKGYYVNWKAIGEMSEEEAGEFYNGLLNTFCNKKPMTYEELLDKPSTVWNGTWREWLKDALLSLLKDGEGFSGKRPNCNSGWQDELAAALSEIDPAIVSEWEMVDEQRLPYSINWNLYREHCERLIDCLFTG